MSLQAENISLRRELETANEMHSHTLESYHDLVRRDQDRLDNVLGQNQKIIDARIQQPTSERADHEGLKPLGSTRKPWAQVKASVERADRQRAKDLNDKWVKKIDAVEAGDSELKRETITA